MSTAAGVLITLAGVLALAALGWWLVRDYRREGRDIEAEIAAEHGGHVRVLPPEDGGEGEG